MRAFPLLLLAILLALVGCARPAPGATPTAAPSASATPGEITVQIFLTRAADDGMGEPVAVPRQIAASDDPATRIAATLAALLRGPTAAERAAGLQSWFSDATASVPVTVALAEGAATADFGDFSDIIPNASTSTGSQQLMAQLNATLFQFPEVAAVTYRFDGSCDAFWGWLQAGCHPVTREEWGQSPAP